MKIYAPEMLLHERYRFLVRPRLPGDAHTDEACHSPIHRVACYRDGLEAESVQEARKAFVPGEASGKESRHSLLPLEERSGLGQEVVHEHSRLLRLGIQRPGFKGRNPGVLGIGVGDLGVEPLASEDQRGAVLLFVNEKELHLRTERDTR